MCGMLPLHWTANTGKTDPVRKMGNGGGGEGEEGRERKGGRGRKRKEGGREKEGRSGCGKG